MHGVMLGSRWVPAPYPTPTIPSTGLGGAATWGTRLGWRWQGVLPSSACSWPAWTPRGLGREQECLPHCCPWPSAVTRRSPTGASHKPEGVPHPHTGERGSSKQVPPSCARRKTLGSPAGEGEGGLEAQERCLSWSGEGVLPAVGTNKWSLAAAAMVRSACKGGSQTLTVMGCS